jgi:hypothetical protein
MSAEDPRDPLVQQAESLVVSSIELCCNLKRRLEHPDAPKPGNAPLPEKTQGVLSEIAALASVGSRRVWDDWQPLSMQLELEGLFNKIARLANDASDSGPSSSGLQREDPTLPNAQARQPASPPVETIQESPVSPFKMPEVDSIPPGQPSPEDGQRLDPFQDAQPLQPFGESFFVNTLTGDTMAGLPQLLPLPPPALSPTPELSQTVPFTGRPQ